MWDRKGGIYREGGRGYVRLQMALHVHQKDWALSSGQLEAAEVEGRFVPSLCQKASLVPWWRTKGLRVKL